MWRISSLPLAFVFQPVLLLLSFRFVDSASSANAITPIPMELLNPRLTEFRRIDSSGDDQITFSEFLLSDRPWMETMSRRFHSIDGNSDGKVSRKEFEGYFRGKDEEQERQRNHGQQGDNFFKQLGTGLFPPSSPSSSSSAELASPLAHDFDHHHFHNNFPFHAQFLLPASATILGSPQSSPRGRAPIEQQQVTSIPQQGNIQREQILKNDMAAQN
ncbi:hypothetical protein niasHT_024450 [Heterodera trifolii]|uniref:EF-hand domain-containing protein n=1 Tax=Heterodera trifolii TaxID=157864 RepID=A0ABD2JYB0_9BILA